ncbi:MAG: hypothetical protein QOJ23_4382 [Actinomycetota bacterium]|nr:hypothetical protein [Actinomycetota bacterium]
MDASPFPYQGPLAADQVRGRDDLVLELLERVSERRVTALTGPRRYGKTSVLARVAADLAEGGASVVWVDLYEVTSTADLAVRLDEALARAIGPLRSRLASIAASLELNLGVLKVGLARRRSERPDAEATLHLLLDTLVEAGESYPAVVVFDEFPGIVRVPGAAGLLRTKLQHHFQTIGLLFAGSQPSLMRTLFTERTEPFYAQADLVPIGPLDAAAVDAIVGDGFRTSGRDPGTLAASIVSFAGGHPHRTMQLADAGWRVAEPGARYRKAVWEEAVADVRRSTALANEAAYSRYGTGEKVVLRLLAGGHSLFGAAAEVLAVSPGAAQHARDTLLAAGEIVDDAGRLVVVDPVIADWIRHRFGL